MKVWTASPSAFTDTGDNLCLSPSAAKEFKETLAMPAGWVRALKPAWIAAPPSAASGRRPFFVEARQLFHLHAGKARSKRVRFDVPKPTAVWWNRI